ncbi:protein kinase [Streptomyces sp. MUM 203J]|uniref:serine/threonine-protein kinase n=1 Tax=Streptomyces sp. MUM 203J TaxID=2791990 RepID=UPI001F04A612|nr:serine/threonine-protein kinase [Streptomyces sp. MUM 203J]MCH0541087.1 protein kinase [Streptomyces sp. MUM 203J]
MTGDGGTSGGGGPGPRLLPLNGDDPAALGPYQLLGRLGAGGMGRIYLGRTGPGAPLVAVKTLLAEGEVSDADRRRFTREVTLARRVDNVYTAKVVDADPAAPSPWMAIEYIPAPSLAELVRYAGRLPASAIRWIAAGTAQALDALHRQRVVHRDVKPQNILLPLDGPRLIDFGISHAQDITRTAITLGTIAFTSPEQARGEPSTAASDMYSLGATLFHLAVGRPPYPEGEDTLRLLVRVSRGELDLTGLPKALDPLIRPCLDVNPHRRPRPEQVLQRFLAELAGLPNSRSGRRWLPSRWTELIERYERQGAAWSRGAAVTGPDALTVDQRTGAVPPPDPTRVYTQERERAEREREEREREKREERERRAREAERQRILREQAERERRRAEEKRKADEKRKAADERKAEARKRAQAGGGSGAGGRPGGGSGGGPRGGAGARARQPPRPDPPKPAKKARPPAPPQKSGCGGVFMAVVAVVALILLAQSCENPPWSAGRSAATSAGTGASTPTGTRTPYTSGPGYTPRPRDTPRRTSTPRSGDTPRRTSTPRPTHSPRRPAPSAQDRAFRAVRAGDCLKVHGDGFGRWSRSTPERVGCGSAGAYVFVTRTSRTTSTGCPSGQGRGRWSHHGKDGEWTVLCLTRQFRAGQCFTAKIDNSSRASANLLVVWNCSSTRVPKGQTHILRITGYYRKPTGRPVNCGIRDSRYWTWDVNDGRSVICAKVA